MTDNQQENEGAKPKYWKLVALGAGVIYALGS
ncbi:MAG: hypothetical protein JWQ49_4875 [Edaphobacter sp.]|nr:hypothetical protein [Edaphobacter sp.]